MCSGVCGAAVIWLASFVDVDATPSNEVMTPVAAEMRQHAESFLAALSDAQRLSAQKSIDDESRTDWTFFPRVRDGLELADLRENAVAFAAAEALLDCGLSESGAKTAADIRRLDPQEDRGGGVRLGPDRYAITIFGQPSSNARWGWRVEGHHLTLNWTIEAGRVVSVTPMALGISPFVDQAGKPQALGEDQQAYLDFLGTLDAKTRAGAKRDGPIPAEVPGVASLAQHRGTGLGFGSRNCLKQHKPPHGKFGHRVRPVGSRIGMDAASLRSCSSGRYFLQLEWDRFGFSAQRVSHRRERFHIRFCERRTRATTCTRCTGKPGATLVKRSRIGLEGLGPVFHRRPRVVPSEHPVVFRHAL